MSDLRTVIKQVIHKVEKHRDLYSRSEQSVRDQLINPILKTLGWDSSDPDLVHANITNDDGKIPDYTLLKGGYRRLILEAKRLSRNLEDGKVIKQLAEYCYPHGIEFGIITDGIVWQLFNTFERNPNNRIVWTIDVSRCEDQELMKLEMLHYNTIEQLEEELNQTKLINDYFESILLNRNTFLKWCESSMKEKFIKENKQYKFKEDTLQKIIAQRLNVFLTESNSINDKTPKIVLAEETEIKSKSLIVDGTNEKFHVYNINSPYDLAFTKIIEGRIENVTAKNWISLIHILLKKLILEDRPVNDIKKISNLNIVKGNLSENGFCLIEGTSYSIQGVSANRGAQAILLLAKEYDKKIEIDFIWRDKQGAAFPNQNGKIINLHRRT